MASSVRKCIVCQREFVAQNARIQCCSSRCSDINHHKKRVERRQQMREQLGLKPGMRLGIKKATGVCLVCGKTIIGCRTTRKYCDSEECRHIKVIALRDGISIEEARQKNEMLKKLRVENAIRRQMKEEAREHGNKRACAYFGQAVPEYPILAQMSTGCRRDGMVNVCRLKHKCPFGR